MKNKKICIIGAFDFIGLSTGGQPVKTRELYNLILAKHGKNQVNFVETYKWKKKIFSFSCSLIYNLLLSDIFIILPAQNGISIFSYIFYFLKKINVKNKVYYSVIGGWLPEKLENNSRLIKKISIFEGIWVETNLMKKSLNSMGLNRVSIIPNFKNLPRVKFEDLPNVLTQPLKLCTFSRVMREKGIEDAIDAVCAINNKYGKIIFTLDVFGNIDDNYKDIFFEIMKNVPEYIKYKGIVMPNDSVYVLKNYFCLLFPTRFYTEGLPGTVIDAYASGLPIITTLWKNYEEIFIESITGWGYELGNNNELVRLLEKAAFNPAEIIKMRKNCLMEAQKFRPESVYQQIIKEMK